MLGKKGRNSIWIRALYPLLLDIISGKWPGWSIIISLEHHRQMVTDSGFKNLLISSCFVGTSYRNLRKYFWTPYLRNGMGDLSFFAINFSEEHLFLIKANAWMNYPLLLRTPYRNFEKMILDTLPRKRLGCLCLPTKTKRKKEEISNCFFRFLSWLDLLHQVCYTLIKYWHLQKFLDYDFLDIVHFLLWKPLDKNVPSWREAKINVGDEMTKLFFLVKTLETFCLCSTYLMENVIMKLMMQKYTHSTSFAIITLQISSKFSW